MKALPEPGTVVDGKFRIERVIGEGGMGRVFAARHEVLDQRIALKFLFPEVAERPHVVERFLREAKAAAKLKSDHVCRVMDAGTSEDGLPFLVMECLEGADLMELLKLNGPMPEDEVVDLMVQTLEAIAHAHAAGLVHRDLKPSNIFLATLPDGSNVVKVLDFGIAKSIAARGEEVATLTGQNIMGSPAYMSPEQIRNARTVDPRSDIWSLGVVMFELVTGKLPYTFDGVGELLAAVLEQVPLPARARNAAVSEATEKVIARALRRDRDKRFQDVGEFARALAPLVSPRWVGLVDRIETLVANSATAAPRTGRGSAGSFPSFPAPSEIAAPAPPPPDASVEELTTGDVLRTADLEVSTVTTVEFPVAGGANDVGRGSARARPRRRRAPRPTVLTLVAGAAGIFLAGLVAAELRRPSASGAPSSAEPPHPIAVAAAGTGAAAAQAPLDPPAASAQGPGAQSADAATAPSADPEVTMELPADDPSGGPSTKGPTAPSKGSIAKPSAPRTPRPPEKAPVRPKALRSRE